MKSLAAALLTWHSKDPVSSIPKDSLVKCSLLHFSTVHVQWSPTSFRSSLISGLSYLMSMEQFPFTNWCTSIQIIYYQFYCNETGTQFTVEINVLTQREQLKIIQITTYTKFHTTDLQDSFNREYSTVCITLYSRYHSFWDK